nr:hypothetical protein [Tanacetum cinerariifolium]
MDRSRNRSRPHMRDSSNGDHSQSRECSRGVGESYDNSHSSYGTNHGYRYRDRDRSRRMKRGRDSESLLSHVSKSGSSDGGHWKSKRHKPTDEDDLTMPWMCEEWECLKHFIPNIKDPVEIYNIKQKDEETIEDFMERFKVEIGRMKGAPECMRIFGLMHEVNNSELTKCLNEHVRKIMEEMMITTVAFIREEAVAAGKKKGHTSWRTQDQSKRHTSEKRSDFRGKFQPPPPMVTLLEKKSNNKFCDFHNDKGHSTDECMQLKKQIEELVRAGKLSHLIKEIKQGRDQSKVGKKEAPAKDKPMAIYMIQSWQRMTRQKVTQSFERVREIMFPSLATSSGTEGPLVIEAKIDGHMIHYMLLVTIGDADHSTRVWMNFVLAHEMLKFPANEGIVTIRSTILIPAECTMVITSSKEIPKEAGVHHGNFKVALHPNFPDQEVAIEGTLSAKGRTELCLLLKENLDIFAWQPLEITGVPRSIAEHRLNIREGYSTVRQKKRGQAPERAKAIQEEVQKLVEAWDHERGLLPRLVVQSSHGKKARRQLANVRRFHEFKQGLSAGLLPLPEIDWKVKSLCGYHFKCFLDAYKGYHQIKLAESDEEKTAFHTGQGVYCYTKMPFGIKNVGATYQRLVDKSFDSQIVEEMFLGYMITPEGIKPCPDKTEAVLQLPSTRTIKEGDGSDVSLLCKPRITGPETELYPNGKVSSITSFRSQEASEVLVEILKEKSIQEKEVTTVVEEDGPTWMTPIIEYLKEGTLPDDRKEARKLRIKARQYELLEGFLYRRSFLTDVRDMIRACNDCQIHRPVTRNPQQPLTLIRDPWLFYKWGIDIAGLFSEGPEIVSDNGKQFSDNPFKDWCDKLNITKRFASVKHPQYNGLVERANRSLGEGIKARMGEGNKNWIEELSHVLWAHRTMIKSSHGDTPFSLTYGTEAVIPAEIGMPTYRTATVDVIHNDEELWLNLDLLEERRDFVYRSNDASDAVDGGKLSPKWEGPYEAMEALGDGAYKLRSADGMVLSRTWNIANLKKCYHYDTAHAWMDPHYS